MKQIFTRKPVSRGIKSFGKTALTACFAWILSAVALVAAESAEKLNIAILAGTEGNEFDNAVNELHWNADKYPDTSEGWERMKKNLKKYDLILGTPGIHTILPGGVRTESPETISLDNAKTDDSLNAKEEAAVLRTFMENGGAIVLTDAVQSNSLDWLSLLDAKYEILAETPAKTPEKFVVQDVKHTFLSLPDVLENTGKISHFYKPKRPQEWETAARWTGQPCISVKRFGKGFVVLSTLRHPTAALLRNTAKMLRLQRMGLRFDRLEHDFSNVKNTYNQKIIAPGRGETRIFLKNTSDRNLVMTGILRMSNGKETREIKRGTSEVKPNANVSLSIPVMADLRGNVHVQVSLVNPGDSSEITIHEEKIKLPGFLSVVPPPYRGMISTARRDKNVHFKIRFSPIYENIEGIPLSLTLYAPDGKIISKKELTVRTAEFGVVMELPADAPEGEYTIKAVAKRAPANEESAQTVFRIVPVRPGQVFVDQDTVLLKEGKPFFPLGIYHVSGNEIENAAKTGFNMIQMWNWDSTPDNLARVAKSGMSILWEGSAWGRAVRIHPASGETDASFRNELAVMRSVAEKLKKNPALSMWYVADEPSSYSLPLLRMINDTWHGADEDHPTYLVSTGDYRQLPTACDVLAIDVYPVYFGQRNNLSVIANAVDEARKGVDFRKPVIAVPQAFGNNKKHMEKPDDVRAMSYLFLTHGVKGIIWYCWKETGDKSGEEGAGYHPDTKKVLSDLVSEIKVFAPALMCPGNRMFKADDGRIHAMICGNDASGRFLLFVNDSLDNVKSTLRVPELAGKKLTSLFGIPAAEEKNGFLNLP